MICSKCEDDLPKSQFSRYKKNGSFYRLSTCKGCRAMNESKRRDCARNREFNELIYRVFGRMV